MFNANTYSSLDQLLVSKVPTLNKVIREVSVDILNTHTHFYIPLANLYMTPEGNK